MFQVHYMSDEELRVCAEKTQAAIMNMVGFPDRCEVKLCTYFGIVEGHEEYKVV